MNEEKIINKIYELGYIVIKKIDEAINNLKEYNEQLNVIDDSLCDFEKYQNGEIKLEKIFDKKEEIENFKNLPSHAIKNIITILGKMEYDTMSFTGTVADINEIATKLKDFQYKSRFDDLRKNIELELKMYRCERIATEIKIQLLYNKISGDRAEVKLSDEIQGLLK